MDKRKRLVGREKLGARDVIVRGLEVDKFRGPRQEEEEEEEEEEEDRASLLVGAQQQRSGGMGWDRWDGGGRPGEKVVGGGGRSEGRESGGEDSSWAGSERMLFARPDGSLDLVRQPALFLPFCYFFFIYYILLFLSLFFYLLFIIYHYYYLLFLVPALVLPLSCPLSLHAACHVRSRIHASSLFLSLPPSMQHPSLERDLCFVLFYFTFTSSSSLFLSLLPSLHATSLHATSSPSLVHWHVLARAGVRTCACASVLLCS